MSGLFSVACLGFALGLSSLSACSSEELEGAKAEVAQTSIKLDLPAVPAFDIPKSNADGSHPVNEMRLNGKTFLDTEVRIEGVVLWIYDCGKAIKTLEMTDKEVEEILEKHPERCVRPHFLIGESATSKVERGVEIVEYPRAMRKDEEGMFGEEEEAKRIQAFADLPEFKEGDTVVVTGTWKLLTQGGFQNSEGLLLYGSMVNMTLPAAPEEAPKK